MQTQFKGFKINGTKISEQNLTAFVSHLVSPNGTDYILKVDDNGNLFAYKEESIEPYTPPTEKGLVSYWASPVKKSCLLYINSFYCGGDEANEHTANYCSHNFVELSNLTSNDINLEGLTLQYTINSTDWKVLPLHGIIKAGSTFLIRGAQCSSLSSPLLKINVDKYDMEWKLDGSPIAFNSVKGAKFYLAFNLNACDVANPYNTTTLDADTIGYVDLVGVKGTISSSEIGVDGFENKPYEKGILSNKFLYKKYYAMDPVKQATKGIGSRNNANDWCHIDLTKENGELIPCIEVYRPMASFENKNLFYNKTNLEENKPSMITCSFGIQATDNGEGATRCFNWLSKNINDKYLWVREEGSTDWGEPIESFNAEDNRTVYNSDNERLIYDRAVKEYTNNTFVIVNKLIINNISAGTYEYIAGRKNDEGNPIIENCTDIHKFTVRSNTEIANGFTFVQTSDQQGFNWEEYRVWQAAAKCIVKEYPNVQFSVNTGDMTQNGNRMGEWLDYFNAKDELSNMEEMASIGNNDLSLNKLYKMGNGEDNNKLWHENITLFYTFESDTDNMPIFKINNNDYYIPSLYSFNYGNTHFICMNTEIKKDSEFEKDGYDFGAGNFGNFYPLIKEWCENDIEKYNGYNWNIMYCHEMPFTILTPAMASGATADTANREGSNANINTPTNMQYWLSEFCQTHNIPLVFGGHKHTQSTSYPIMENVKYVDGGRIVKSMKPIIVVNEALLSEFNATSLVEYEDGKYPDSWLNGDTPKPGDYAQMMKLCTFIMEDEVAEGNNPVVYAMSQATGYKHTSNKELPSPNIPWLRYYFPSTVKSLEDLDSPTVNANQKFPFFTIWNISPTQIIGNVRKVYGAFDDSGKFDINKDGPWVLNGKCATTKGIGDHSSDIFSINGITSMDNAEAKTDTRIITISK